MASDCLALEAKVEAVSLEGEWDSDLVRYNYLAGVQWPVLSDPTIAVCQHYVGFIEQVYTHQEQVVNMC